MGTFQRFTAQLVFFLQLLLLFLLFFQHKVVLPSWLAVGGRMHPLLLHLPIGMLAAFALSWWAKPLAGGGNPAFYRFLLALSALTGSVTALAGFFLSREGGYDPVLLSWHQWLGVAFSFALWGLWWLFDRDAGHKWAFHAALGASLALMIIAGHLGSSITHGGNYLFEPLMPEKNAQAAVEITEETPLFVAAVLPILQDKCTGCHNERKAKGKLVMTDPDRLSAGGKSGPLWVAGDLQNSLILQRLHLPMEEKKHMPPSGKPQLTTGEAEIIRQWIAAGADMGKPIAGYPENDTLRLTAETLMRKQRQTDEPAMAYAFKPASPAVIKKLNNPFLSVSALAFGSPALQADFSIRRMFDRKQFENLREIDQQLVDLNLANMPISDDDLRTLVRFSNLEVLNLNNTDITGAGLSELKSLKNLRSLSLAGTAVQKDHIRKIGDFPALKEVFLWNTKISPTDSAELARSYPGIRFFLGYEDAGNPLPLPPPILVNESDILARGEQVELKHYMPGVEIRYTLDGADADTLSSTVYESPLTITRPTMVKARAVKEGWYASPQVEFYFFLDGQKPDKIELLSPPNEKYRAGGAEVLLDKRRGNIANFTQSWLGFRETPMELLFTFEKDTPELSSFVLSYGVNVNSFIMPPVELQVWAGDDPSNLSLLVRASPRQCTENDKGLRGSFGQEAAFPAGRRKFYKVIAQPLSVLPPWHPGKGDKGWLFADEVFFYGS